MDPLLSKLDKIIERLDKVIEQGEPQVEYKLLEKAHYEYPWRTFTGFPLHSTLPEVDDSTPDCNCSYNSDWHFCDFHNWCNPVTGVGV